MTTLLTIAAIAALESFAHLLRYRSANARSAWLSALHTGFVCYLRIAFMLVGFDAVMESADRLTLVLE